MIQGQIDDSIQRHLRILIPIDATEPSRWGVAYALRRHAEGCVVEACFLNVGEPITQWEVLRFRTQSEITTFQSERAQAFIEDACSPLVAKGITCRGFFKQGDLEFAILNSAEELECDEIVMPRPTDGLWGMLGRGMTKAVFRRQRDIPIVVVDQDAKIMNHLIS